MSTPPKFKPGDVVVCVNIGSKIPVWFLDVNKRLTVGNEYTIASLSGPDAVILEVDDLGDDGFNYHKDRFELAHKFKYSDEEVI